MLIEKFVKIISSDFYTGVPDSQLKALCDYLMNEYGVDKKHHIVAANEGNAVAIAAGYYLASGNVPVVYLQNSGEGNILNPVASLLNNKVYAIPMIFVVGWRGEPGVHDEPQHIYQGEVTVKILEDLDIDTFVVGKDTSEEELEAVMAEFSRILANGRQVAFVIKKGALKYNNKIEYKNDNRLIREEIIKHIVKVTMDDLIVSTTGKTSRELFEIRKLIGQNHKRDFLTVGSMGHSSSIALGIALSKPDKRVWCIDGDGAVLMHMGAMAVIGSNNPRNMVHIVINNSAHESVGGVPTVMNDIDVVAVAKACGYENAVSVEDYERLDEELLKVKVREGLSFIEIKCAIGSRDDLGRPTTTPIENKISFMSFLNE